MAHEPAGRAEPVRHIDNDRVRVTEWRFAPDAATGFHRHELDYVIVPLGDGRLELVDGEGRRSEAALKLGQPYFRKAGVEHDVINATGAPFAFIEVEIKAR